jgi:alginate O-acetyltransferase complex protein AlgI
MAEPNISHPRTSSPRFATLPWLPLAVLPAATLALAPWLPPWALMWALCFAIFIGCKWLTYATAVARARAGYPGLGWSLAYLFAWVGLDAKAFFSRRPVPRPPPPLREWLSASAKTIAGALLLWIVVRHIPESHPLARGWTGLLGLVLLLHFGLFHLLALAWQRAGVDAQPIMRLPTRARSLADFWSARWNLAFRDGLHPYVFRPLHRRVGLIAATLLAFTLSGLVHDLVISIPARAGFGLPTAYFLLQAAGILLERSAVGRLLRLKRPLPGWLFTFLFTAPPAFFLFHPPFLRRVILPFLKVLHAF